MDEEEYLDDAAFYDNEGFDEPGTPYAPLRTPAWLADLLAGPTIVEEPPAEPAPDPVWDKPLLTAEEWIAKYGWGGTGKPRPADPE